jgi:hypothetical protein
VIYGVSRCLSIHHVELVVEIDMDLDVDFEFDTMVCEYANT